MSISSLLRRPFRVEYRLTMLIAGRFVNSYRQAHGWRDSRNQRRIFRNLANHTADADYWALYKRGPFGLPEREVDSETICNRTGGRNE